MCETCKRSGIRPEYEAILHQEYGTRLPATIRTASPSKAPLPNGLPALPHFSVIKRVDPTSQLLVSTKTPSVITPQNMNPGYLNLGNNSLVTAPALQQGLEALIKNKYKKYVRGDRPSAQDNLFVALVDLTGNKMAMPEYAGWGSTVARMAASTAKIVFLYAIHQLRFDLEVQLNDAAVTNLPDAIKFIDNFQRKFNLSANSLSWGKIFDYNFDSGNVKVSFGNSLATSIIHAFKQNNNFEASRLLHHVSFPYLGSLLWQSGLRHPKLGGLWHTSDYGFPGGSRSWINPPSVGTQVSTHNATALSIASFFTLMAQGRLVNDAASRQIKEVLREACSFFWTNRFKSVIGITRRPATKCGIWSKFMNDVALIEYDSGKYKYVACILTDLSSETNFSLPNFLLDLDGVIRRNNP